MDGAGTAGPAMSDVIETRELSYFVAVAEELHFGRAAQRLGIAQPALSRAIKQLERRVGAVLLDRSSRRVVLTAAGEVLLREGRQALDAVAAATRLARRAGRPQARLVLVMKPGGDGGLLADVLAAYESEPGAVPVEVVVCRAGEQPALLRDGRADVGFLRRPHNDLIGLAAEELLVERQVLVVPAGHPLAGRPSLRLADLGGLTLPPWPGVPVEGPAGPEVREVSELMQLIALGRMVAVVPESVRAHVRRDLVCVPVLDAPPTTVVLAWRRRAPSQPLAAFLRAAKAVAASRQPPLDTPFGATGLAGHQDR